MRPLLLALAVSLASCGTSDLGSPCEMPASVEAGEPAFDYLYLGTAECDDLVCLRRKGTTSSVCSRACLDESDCEPGFACVKLVPSVEMEGVDATSYCTRAP